MFRDPRYLAPLGVLVGVIVVAAVAAHSGSGRGAAGAAPPATPAVEQIAPPATATPRDVDGDARRIADLVKVRDAMLTYRQKHGRFPVSEQLAPLCVGASDAGCVLAPAPFADGDEPYRFRSDGERVYLVARAEAASDPAQCPPTLPDDLTGVPILCLHFARPAQ